MSRLAKKPIPVPAKVEVSISNSILSVKGSKGALTKPIHSTVSIVVGADGVQVSPNDNSRLAMALIGTYAAHVRSMMQGVETPFVKKLVLDGVGYKYEVKGNEIVMNVGFSHQVKMPIPAGLTATTEKSVMTISGIDKEAVGQFAANVRRVKPPEPYLGKGIRYEGEVIRRKQGKKAA
jgi:large subunit ribosomal protein L6